MYTYSHEVQPAAYGRPIAKLTNTDHSTARLWWGPSASVFADYKSAASDVSLRVVQAEAEVGLVSKPGQHNTKGMVR